ncbi:hypothetical protein, partial [Mesorhizobium sp. M2E.F.Ca.ET.154.01.1.1]|uniref:hypothetical protein n=1 Tax=Mesorhizobium sp. M2E.F.Ca.ET.154.01.1.1 TaxID=2500521 RepID=UPI001AEDA3BB
LDRVLEAGACHARLDPVGNLLNAHGGPPQSLRLTRIGSRPLGEAPAPRLAFTGTSAYSFGLTFTSTWPPCGMVATMLHVA